MDTECIIDAKEVIMLQESRQLTFRPSPTPALLSPVTVRSAGHYQLRSLHEDRSGREFSQIFWIDSGCLTYSRKSRAYLAGAGMTFFYPAGESHKIDIKDGYCDYWWATFDGPRIGQWLDNIFRDPAPRQAGPCPVGLFSEIRDSLNLPSLAAERDTALLGLHLLVKFSGTAQGSPDSQLSPEEKLCSRLEGLLETHFANPEFGIEAAARKLGRHRSTLFRTYRARRGITPSAYLQRLRLRHGLELLRTGTLSVTEIAHASGFRDVNYFSKVIREATGDSPRQVRNRLPGK